MIVRPPEPEEELKDIIGYESGSNFWNVDALKPKKDSKLYVLETKPIEDQVKNQAFKKVKEELPRIDDKKFAKQEKK